MACSVSLGDATEVCASSLLFQARKDMFPQVLELARVAKEARLVGRYKVKQHHFFGKRVEQEIPVRSYVWQGQYLYALMQPASQQSPFVPRETEAGPVLNILPNLIENCISHGLPFAVKQASTVGYSPHVGNNVITPP